MQKEKTGNIIFQLHKNLIKRKCCGICDDNLKHFETCWIVKETNQDDQTLCHSCYIEFRKWLDEIYNDYV